VSLASCACARRGLQQARGLPWYSRGLQLHHSRPGGTKPANQRTKITVGPAYTAILVVQGWGTPAFHIAFATIRKQRRASTGTQRTPVEVEVSEWSSRGGRDRTGVAPSAMLESVRTTIPSHMEQGVDVGEQTSIAQRFGTATKPGCCNTRQREARLRRAPTRLSLAMGR
jgi:hypothetical protein